MSVKATASQASDRWQQNFGAAGTRYTEGINAVTVAPGQLAAANKAAYLANVQASANVWASKVSAVQLGEWKAAATGVGAQRLATGATKGAPKVSAFMSKFLPELSSVVGGLQPRGTFDQNLARFTAYAQALHAKKGQF
jgi:hypothetical protein